MANESTVWIRLKEILKKHHPVRVENSACPGYPDVDSALGQIELKCRNNWTVKKTVNFKELHFSPEQRIWLFRRWKAGGSCFLLIQIEDTWYLVPGDKAFSLPEICTQQQLQDHSVFYEKVKLFTQEDFVRCMTRN